MLLGLQTAPGLAPLLWKEVRGLDPYAQRRDTLFLPGRNDLLMVESDEPSLLLRSRLAEDVFAVVGLSRNIGLGRKGLDQLADLARTASGWDEALALHKELTGGRGGKRTSTLRVVARAQGERGYGRNEAKEAMERALLSRLGRRWRVVSENAQVEVWLTLVDAEAVLAVRLTSATQRHRGKAGHIAASLRPAIAAAMVYLSEPRPDDVCLDPFCGAGTILVERARAGQYRLLIGSDISGEAIEAAQQNIGDRFKPIELHVWDATRIPLDDGSVSAIVTNPPFGEQIGSHEANKSLYPRFLEEFHRLLPNGGRLVVLTPEDRLMQRAIEGGSWTQVGRYPIEVLGKRATIYSLRRS